MAGLSALLGLGYLGFSANWETAHAGHAAWYTVLFDAVSYWVVVLGAESLVFGLMPMRFLDGHTLASWRLLAWIPLQTAAGFFFWYVIHRRGEIAGGPDPHEWLRAIGFFLLFGLAATAFWGYFQWKQRPTVIFSPRPMVPIDVPSRLAALVHRVRAELAELWRAVSVRRKDRRPSLPARARIPADRAAPEGDQLTRSG